MTMKSVPLSIDMPTDPWHRPVPGCSTRHVDCGGCLCSQ
ncbi:hypothetical protein HMPREF9947_1806 [Propionibacterium sp. 409-HC1]|nr:hypothetical protein HMPREF9947_1806 [Propionibacterium sp. 409-HC1]